MNIIEALILGIIQGLTEFIPVSSSGHLVIAHEAMGITANGLAFDVALHIGTLMALIAFFYKDIIRLTRAIFVKSRETRMAWLMVVATIPAVFAGLLLEDLAEDSFRSVTLVCINLIFLALLMLIAENSAKHKTNKTKLNNVTKKQAVFMGLAQAVSVVPGVSRSGSTITAGIFTGLDRVSATRFSFLLGIPITLGAILKVLIKPESFSRIKSETDLFLIGIITAFLTGAWAIGFLLKYLAKHSLNIFAYYRIALALIVLSIALF